MRNCDIIIPVFKGYEYLKKCLESILLYTKLENNRIIIVDDKSDDKRIVLYIEDLRYKNHDRIVFVKNERHLGFFKTVNIGISYSNNDVVLLRPDAEAPEGWLEKLQRCAYSKERVATVTPLSNTSSFVAIPISSKQGKFQDDFNLSNYQILLDSISYTENYEIPVCMDICLYIKREVLNIIGLFSEKEFVGIEDFGYRCLDHGYRHLLCDNVIILNHNDKWKPHYYDQNIFEKKEKLLMENYLINKNISDLWFLRHPLKFIGKNINFNLCLNNGNSNVLIIIHMWDKDIEGGTSFHILDLIKGLKSKYNFHVLAPYDGTYRLCSYWKTGEESINIYKYNASGYSNSLFDSKYANMLNSIIDFFRINSIHIHHLLGHYFDIVDIVKNRKVKLFITLHDYYAVCPRINKFNYIENRYCSNYDENECDFCLRFFSEKIRSINAWKNIWNLLFAYANRVIVPSESARKEVLNTYEHIFVDVIEHGVDIIRAEKKLNIETDEFFHIAFIGNLIMIKGKAIVKELIKYASELNNNIYFHLFGFSDPDFFHENEYKNFIDHGKYHRPELGKLLKDNNIKLVCIFSIWPETYSYTLTESIANNIPVLGIDKGAVGQRIKDNNLGWLIKNGSSTVEIYEKIINIFKNKVEYKYISKAISTYKIKNIEEMAHDYDKIYSDYENRNLKNMSINKMKLFIKDNYLYNFYQHRNPSQRETGEIEQIYKSYSWRIGRIITYIPRKTIRLIQYFNSYGIKQTIKLAKLRLRENTLFK